MTSPDSMQRLIDQGMASRTVGSTAMNDTSSRSHSVFTVKVGRVWLCRHQQPSRWHEISVHALPRMTQGGDRSQEQFV